LSTQYFDLYYWTKVNLGVFYFKGIGVTENRDKAIESLNQATEQGSPHAAGVIESLSK